MEAGIKKIKLIGYICFLGVLCVGVGSIIVLTIHSEYNTLITPYERQVIIFTFYQAFLSAGLSLSLAIPISRAIYRNDFFGKKLIISVIGILFVLPILVVILAVINVFGMNGVINQSIGYLGFEKFSIYGLIGILTGHILINLPFAVRLLISGWSMIPTEHVRLAKQLGFGKRAFFEHIELPMLIKIAPGIFTIIFLYCSLTFSIALVLGGGPSATTVELAIYQAIVFEGDLAAAARLSTFQLICLTLLLILSTKFSGNMFVEQTIVLKNNMRGPRTKLSHWLDCFFIGLFCIFIFLPILIIGFKGLENIAIPKIDFILPAINSLIVALIATLINLTISLFLCVLIVDEKQKVVRTLFEVGSFSIICISPLVFGTAFFLLLFEYIDISANALLLTGVTNGILMIPISLAILLPGFKRLKARYGKLMTIIGVSRSSELVKFYIPLLKKNIKFSCALVFTLSIGDLGIIVLFSGTEMGTLPMYLYRLIGSYRMDEAYFVAMILLLMAFLSFWIIENGNLNAFKRKQM